MIHRQARARDHLRLTLSLTPLAAVVAYGAYAEDNARTAVLLAAFGAISVVAAWVVLNRALGRARKLSFHLQSFSNLIENTDNVVAIASPDRKLTYLNRAAREKLGFGDADVTKTASSVLYGEGFDDVINAEVVPALRRKEKWRGEVPMRHQQHQRSGPGAVDDLSALRYRDRRDAGLRDDRHRFARTPQTRASPRSLLQHVARHAGHCQHRGLLRASEPGLLASARVHPGGTLRRAMLRLRASRRPGSHHRRDRTSKPRRDRVVVRKPLPHQRRRVPLVLLEIVPRRRLALRRGPRHLPSKKSRPRRCSACGTRRSRPRAPSPSF